MCHNNKDLSGIIIIVKMYYINERDNNNLNFRSNIYTFRSNTR